ncbi:MAG: S8/S53 family peptidase [Longimicrobiaceae bacterium]
MTPKLDGADAPPFAENALVIKLRDPEGVRAAVEGYKGSPLLARGGLPAVLRHVDRSGLVGAKLTPIYPERALEVLSREGPVEGGLPGEAAWKVAVPDYETPRQELSAYHYLELGSEGPANAELEAKLRKDPLIALVYHPAIPYARDASPDGDKVDGEDPQWGLERCGFREVWNELDKGFDPGPIGVIDEGGDIGHGELLDLVQVCGSPGNDSTQTHASAVMGVLAALRDNKGMDGCCSARIVLYDVSGSSDQTPLYFILALKAAACRGLRVLNVSMEMERDQCVADQIKECVDEGMIIVAAMGNKNSMVPAYPAGYDGVIAVGATNRNGDKLKASNTGKHICISAPGELILTIKDAQTLSQEDHNGTSYAAPMVSAAAWLALRARPHFCGHHMKDFLAKCVNGVGPFSMQLGHGRLDMRRMLQELKC